MDASLLSAAVLHDVKNSLAELQLRLSGHGGMAEEQALVSRCAQRLSELLLIQRDQGGVLQAAIDAARPAELIADLAAEYSALFPAVRVVSEVATAPDTGFYDAFLLRMALANAVHNACRHASAMVRLSVRGEGAGLVFEVADDGPGFSHELLQRDPDQPLPPSAHGTGLGFYLAERIAKLHQLSGCAGHTELINDAGAVFRLHLP